MKLCSVEGCGKKESARGWCSMHYWRWKEHGDLNHQRAILPTTCSIDDCERPRDRRGWCTHHYTQWWKYGDPLYDGREKQTMCKVKDCKHPRRSKGTMVLCEMHYLEWSRQKKRESYQRNKEQRIQESLDRQAKNPDYFVAYGKKYGERPKVKARRLERERMHRAIDPSKHRTKNRRHAHLRRATEGSYSEEQWQTRLDFYGRKCYLCGCDWDALDHFDQTIDHVIPLSKGGTNWPDNLAPACRSCNSKKNARPLTEVLAA